jgi:Protein of unknown function (DUF3551)
MSFSRCLVLIAVVALTVLTGARPSNAMVIYPWCASYSGRGAGGENCGFVNFNQCLATVRGVGGFCKPNPWYYPYPPSPAGAPPLWR